MKIIPWWRKIKGYTKTIICLLIILTSLLIAGCYYYTPTGDVIEEGFRVRRSTIVGAVRSKVNTFDIDDVTLDFYVGGDTINEVYSQAILLYFADRFERPIDHPKPEEYKTTDGYYFVDEIDIETFNNGPFDVSTRYGYIGDNFYFRFLRKLTIPKELFEADEGRIEFLVASLPPIDEETKEYKFDIHIYDSICLDYRKLDNGKIMMSTIY